MKYVIRDAELKDAEDILNIYSYYITDTAITFEYDVPEIESFRNRMAGIMEKYPYIVVTENGKILGYAYAGAFKQRAAYDWCCELTVYIDKNHKKCGLGKLLYSELEKRLVQMGIVNMYACITYTDNEDRYLTNNSFEFHSHIGFELVGRFKKCGYKFGKWYDMVWTEKVMGSHNADMQPVKFRN